MELNNIPWIEKYRPTSLNDILSHDKIVNTLRNFVKNNDLPHLLFYGPPGTGKTSTIYSCAQELYGENIEVLVLKINVSEERGIEVVRNKIHQFVQSKNLLFSDIKYFKLVILDECDSMTPDAQANLRMTIEKYTSNARFCLICNYIKKINIALQSRCTLFRFSPISDNIMKDKLLFISKNENFTFEDNLCLDIIINKSSGDFRKAINIIQTCSMQNNIINSYLVNKTLGIPQNYEIELLLNTLMNKNINIINSFKIISNLKNNEGYSLSDIITELFKKIQFLFLDNNLNIDLYIKYTKFLSNIEYNLTNNTNDDIQLSSLISIFKS